MANAGKPFAPYFMTAVYSNQASFYNSVAPAAIMKIDLQTIDQHNENVWNLTGTCASGAPAQVNQNVVKLCPHEDVVKQYAKDYVAFLTTNFNGKGVYLDSMSIFPHYECYDPDHSHPKGGGNWHVVARQDIVNQIRTLMRDEVEDFYTLSEGQSEMFLKQFELVFEHHSFALIGEHGVLPVIRVPLFESVYHDYQLTSDVFQINLPANHSSNNAGTHNFGRFWYAMRTHFGGAPFAGSILSPTSLQNNRTTHATFNTLVNAVANYLDVLKRADVRAMTTFGERMRDPGTNATKVTYLPAGNFGWGSLQPIVLASAWARPDLDRMGVLLQNWTDYATDGFGGDQSVQVTVDTSGLASGNYNVFIAESGAATVPGGSFTASPTYIFTTTVKGITSKFVYFVKQ